VCVMCVYVCIEARFGRFLLFDVMILVECCERSHEGIFLFARILPALIQHEFSDYFLRTLFSFKKQDESVCCLRHLFPTHLNRE